MREPGLLQFTVPSRRDAEEFVAGIWRCLEKHQLPSPTLHVVERQGALEINAYFDDEKQVHLILSEVPRLHEETSLDVSR
jgi:hypothetical protein